MIELEYEPFDYFITPKEELLLDYSELTCEKFGINTLDVLIYLDGMRRDRDEWKRKESSINLWGFIFQCIISIFIPFIFFAAKILLCRWLEIENEDSFINDFLSGFFIVLIIGFERYLWKNDVVANWFEAWSERKYKKRTQYNSVIEKYLEDCHWKCFEQYKFLNGRS